MGVSRAVLRSAAPGPAAADAVPLTNPTAHGGRAEDAFHLVVPSMPGYGFSAKPQTTGWGPDRMARA